MVRAPAGRGYRKIGYASSTESGRGHGGADSGFNFNRLQRKSRRLTAESGICLNFFLNGRIGTGSGTRSTTPAWRNAVDIPGGEEVTQLLTAWSEGDEA